MKIAVVTIAALVLMAGFSTNQAAARPIALDDLKSLTGVSDATISPDGTQIAYIVSKPDYKSDRTQRTLMLYDLRVELAAQPDV